MVGQQTYEWGWHRFTEHESIYLIYFSVLYIIYNITIAIYVMYKNNEQPFVIYLICILNHLSPGLILLWVIQVEVEVREPNEPEPGCA